MMFFKKIIAIFMMLLSLLFPNLVKETQQPGEPDTYKIEESTLYVYVKENVSTGYKWTYDIEGTGIIFKDSNWVCDVPDKTIVGAGGTSTYEFAADGEGEFKITMQYLRDWENRIPLEKILIEGSVNADGVITVSEFETIYRP